jgi:RHS repeat-associated protein
MACLRRSLILGLACCIASAAHAPTGALAQGAGPSSGTGDSGAALLESPLVVPEAQPLLGGESASDAEEARRASPEAVTAREESQTKYEGLNAEEAAKLAERTFPGVIAQPGGGLPRLPEGSSVTGYPTDNTAQLDLPGGKRGVIESISPIAVEASPGHRVPVDLGLVEADGGFEPHVSAVGVRLPARVQEGASLADTGVSLTPVDAAGVPTGGSEGQLDGSVVFYGGVGVGSDVDMALKPSTLGFSAETFLRSERSPETLYFRVGLPQGASLTQADAGSGVVEVVDAGATVAYVLPPRATDATGMSVPVEMSVSGDVLQLKVGLGDGEYTFPIDVDPEVVDKTFVAERNNWHEEPEPPSPFEFSQYGVVEEIVDHDRIAKKYARGEWGGMAYETHGASHIYELTAETSATNAGANIENKLFITSLGKGVEKEEVLGSSYSKAKKTLCIESGCATGTVSSADEGNVVEFKQTATNSGEAFESELANPGVAILQEQGPTTPMLNTTAEKINGKHNFFHTGEWLGPGSEAEMSATDPGLGIYEWHAKSPNKSGWSSNSRLPAEWLCKGVQCPSDNSETTEYWPFFDELPNGEDTLEVSAADAAGLSATTTTKVKVDYSLPYDITLSLPANKEIGDTEVKVKATAKDGTTAESSGIESIGLKIDGKEVGKPSGACSPGPCTATSNEWTINGAELAAGQHTATVTAISNAGDVNVETFTFDTGHLASPVALGPGSVSPETGEFFLGATDVSVGGPGATLSVKRNYSSSHLAAGAEGPLGPQWSMSAGGAETLTKAAEGAVVFTSAEGQKSVFTSKGKGEFTSPSLSASLTLSEVTESEKTKEFLLKDASGQVTKFALPSGGTGNTWVPSMLEGPNATNIVTYKYQTVNGITEPTEMLGPVPAGVSCTSELVKGCRALGFVYSTKTTATGNNSSEWGEYSGRLKEVTFTAWEPTSGKMKTTAVAEYVYDKEGRLRGEWNPSISPALETTYGYDAAGHVTAITPPGQQSWLFNYGTTKGDPRARIVSVARPGASTAAGNGSLPANTGLPVISGTLKEEVPASTSNGTWSNSPLSYSYQWERCVENRTTKEWECSPVLGATSQNFTPSERNIRVAVTATNATGSTTAYSKVVNVSLGIFLEQAATFGNEGSAEGDVKESSAIAVESYFSHEDVWVADTGNNRIEKFSPSGTLLATYGKEGKEKEEFEHPDGIAVAGTDVYVADSGNDRIEELSSSNGKFVREVTLPGPPAGVAVGKFDLDGYEEEYMFVAIPSKNYIRYGSVINPSKTLGSVGSENGEFEEPTGLVISSTGEAKGKGDELYVTDKGNHRVQVFGPEELGNFVLKSKFGSDGSGKGQFSTPEGIALEPHNLYELNEESHGYHEELGGTVFISDAGDSRVQQLTPSGEGLETWDFGSGAQGIAVVQGESPYKSTGVGDLYVISAAVTGTPRISKWVPRVPRELPAEPPTPGSTAVTTVEYHVPVSGSEAPYSMGKSEVEAWGQKDDPTEATAIFPPDEPMGWPAKDYKRATVYYLDGAARTVNVAHPGSAISTTEYNAKNDVERTLSPDDRAAALKEGSKSAEASKLLDTENTYNSEGTELQSTLGPQHTVKLASGTQVEARNHKQYAYEEGAPSEGGPYGLPTKTTEGAQYSGKEEEVRETAMAYAGQENLGWKLHRPTSVTADPKGLKLAHTAVYEPSTGEVKETVMPAGNPKEKTAHATETIYYTTAKNSTVPACGEHPEWANLPCQTQPAKQPETSGLPNLPITVTTYNMWDEQEKATETVGSTTRTKTATYNAAGRLEKSAVSSTVGASLPEVTYAYNEKTGALEKQSTTTGGKTKTITSAYNTLGELTSYTDADENTSTYEYDIDGRVTKANDGKGTQTYTYDTTTGDLTKLVDSAAGTFTASYDAEGNMLTESLPNGMNADYTYDSTGGATALEYIKTTHCTEKCTWFSDTVVPSIHGQWLEQTTTLSHQAFTYDNAGRLTQVQNTPTGKGCTTHVYAYEEDTNRTSLTTRAPGSKGECTTTGGTVEKHTYDSADRLTDTGTSYNTFGNITELPAADAGGTELTSAFYVDNQLQSQTQNGETIGYNLDPAGRTRETVATGKTNQDLISHYSGGGDTPAWQSETSSGNWTRNIPGIGGGLAAIQTNGEAPVLQLPDLHGDIIGTASLSETETKLLTTTEPSEFGVPTTSTPPKYSWLGASELPTELPTGIIAMGARSYIPQLGRYLQPDPVPGGSANAYTYTFGDPINTSDPSGALTYGFSGWLKEANNQEAQEVVAREVAREALEREEAERKAREAKEAEERADAPVPAAAEEPLGGYAGWACEYAAETGQEDSECGGGGVGDLHVIEDKGGPGAFCGSNSTNHRKCHEPKGGTERENVEACGVLGGGIGGVIGGAIGDFPGGFAGGVAGQKAAEKACQAV